MTLGLAGVILLVLVQPEGGRGWTTLLGAALALSGSVLFGLGAVLSKLTPIRRIIKRSRDQKAWQSIGRRDQPLATHSSKTDSNGRSNDTRDRSRGEGWKFR